MILHKIIKEEVQPSLPVIALPVNRIQQINEHYGVTHSPAGSVYRRPMKQLKTEQDLLDYMNSRADVFSIGAIVCWSNKWARPNGIGGLYYVHKICRDWDYLQNVVWTDGVPNCALLTSLRFIQRTVDGDSFYEPGHTFWCNLVDKTAADAEVVKREFDDTVQNHIEEWRKTKLNTPEFDKPRQALRS